MSSYQQESSQQAFRWHSSQFDDRNFQIRGRTIFYIAVFFSVIILLTLLFLYTRWICRVPPPPPPPLGASFHAPPPRGLDLAIINRLPIVIYKSALGNFSEAECCICLGIFQEKDEVKMLPDCRHCFHIECVDKWLMVHSSCPICRALIQVDSPV